MVPSTDVIKNSEMGRFSWIIQYNQKGPLEEGGRRVSVRKRCDGEITGHRVRERRRSCASDFEDGLKGLQARNAGSF